MISNGLKAKLGRGEPVFGVSIMIPSPQIVEMVGRLGFDWVLLDCEHGTVTLESLELMTMAAEAAGITAIARPCSSDPDEILAALERGVLGVQVPHVNTPEEARGVVAAVKYAPLGRRGLAARTRPADYGIGIALDDYTRISNEETLICVQLEEVEALRNLDTLLEVEGVDVFFLGPSDLSQSMGVPGRADDPAVREAMSAAFSAITGRGKGAGSAGGADRCRDYLSQGATYLYTHLPALLDVGARAFFETTTPHPT